MVALGKAPACSLDFPSVLCWAQAEAQAGYPVTRVEMPLVELPQGQSRFHLQVSNHYQECSNRFYCFP